MSLSLISEIKDNFLSKSSSSFALIQSALSTKKFTPSFFTAVFHARGAARGGEVGLRELEALPVKIYPFHSRWSVISNLRWVSSSSSPPWLMKMHLPSQPKAVTRASATPEKFPTACTH